MGVRGSQYYCHLMSRDQECSKHPTRRHPSITENNPKGWKTTELHSMLHICSWSCALQLLSHLYWAHQGEEITKVHESGIWPGHNRALYEQKSLLGCLFVLAIDQSVGQWYLFLIFDSNFWTIIGRGDKGVLICSNRGLIEDISTFPLLTDLLKGSLDSPYWRCGPETNTTAHRGLVNEDAPFPSPEPLNQNVPPGD